MKTLSSSTLKALTVASSAFAIANGCPDMVGVDVRSTAPLELQLGGSSDCFEVIDSAGSSSLDQAVRLTIRNNAYDGSGRYGMIEGLYVTHGTSGYAWGDDADGIYYCVKVGDRLAFHEYPSYDPTVSISAELLSEGEDCNRGVISFGGYVPLETPDWGDTTEVYWSDHRYYLTAKHFEYRIESAGETVTMKNAQRISVDGDTGDDEFISISIDWEEEDETWRGLRMDIHGDSTSWWVDNMRIRDNHDDYDEAWCSSYFTPETLGLGALRGAKGTCYQADSITLENDEGDTVKFEQLRLATFLPWTDGAKFLECIRANDTPAGPPGSTSTAGATDSGVEEMKGETNNNEDIPSEAYGSSSGARAREYAMSLAGIALSLTVSV